MMFLSRYGLYTGMEVPYEITVVYHFVTVGRYDRNKVTQGNLNR
jgi:hypothetical protein